MIKQRFLQVVPPHFDQGREEKGAQCNPGIDLDREIYDVQLSLPSQLGAALCEEAGFFGIPVELFMQRIIESAAVYFMKTHRR